MTHDPCIYESSNNTQLQSPARARVYYGSQDPDLLWKHTRPSPTTLLPSASSSKLNWSSRHQSMASEEPATPNPEPEPPQMKWKEKIEGEYKKIREHAETYPYVWASYIVVYGGLAMWTGYRWRKLRKTEDRVRNLQERLRKIVEAEESAAASSSSSSTSKTP